MEHFLEQGIYNNNKKFVSGGMLNRNGALGIRVHANKNKY